MLQSVDAFDSAQPWMYYNGLNEIGTVMLLVLSVCKRDDPQEQLKIREVSYHLDRLFCLLQLQQAYDSNEFASTIYLISQEIREQGAASIRPAFEKQLLRLLVDQHGARGNASLTYSLFKDTGRRLPIRFKRYFFARVEQFIADSTKQNMRHDLNDLVTKGGFKNGFHIEHVLSHNAANLRAFGGDEERFEQERNRLGGLLLLKGRDNVDSSNELYAKKLKTYAATLHWNETLREDAYKSKKDFAEMIQTHQLNFRPLKEFGPAELEERQRLLFDIARIIWQ